MVDQLAAVETTTAAARLVVRVYLVECYQAYRMDEQGAGYSLEPWGDNDDVYYKGDDDGGDPYFLPAGYTAQISQGGNWMIYNPSGRPCTLTGKTHPALVDSDVGSQARRLEAARCDATAINDDEDE